MSAFAFRSTAGRHIVMQKGVLVMREDVAVERVDSEVAARGLQGDAVACSRRRRQTGFGGMRGLYER